MRGRTWQYNVNQIAAKLVTLGEGPDANIAKRAADIVDAVYAELKERNAVDYAALDADVMTAAGLPTFSNTAEAIAAITASDNGKGDEK